LAKLDLVYDFVEAKAGRMTYWQGAKRTQRTAEVHCSIIIVRTNSC
jgi:hypothetical protein